MTVFIEALKTLIQEQLSGAIYDGKSKSRRFGYNHKLSAMQTSMLSKLVNDLGQCKSTDDDESDTRVIIDLMRNTREAIKKLRIDEQQANKPSKAIECLRKQIEYAENFQDKLHKFSFNLLNRPYLQTPDAIIYYHACYYLGQEIFTPESLDVKIRNKKEESLVIRLRQLSELMQLDRSLADQKKIASQIIKDMLADNAQAVMRHTGAGPALPGLSFYGFQVTSPAGLFAASKGRLSEQFNIAMLRIEGIKDIKDIKDNDNTVSKKSSEEHEQDSVGERSRSNSMA